MSDQPTKDELLERAADGNPISQSEVDKIADTERKETGGGIAKGGAAATAQSLHDKQMHFLEVASKVADKPATEVTQKDAADVQHAEVQLPMSRRRELRRDTQTNWCSLQGSCIRNPPLQELDFVHRAVNCRQEREQTSCSGQRLETGSYAIGISSSVCTSMEIGM